MIEYWNKFEEYVEKHMWAQLLLVFFFSIGILVAGLFLASVLLAFMLWDLFVLELFFDPNALFLLRGLVLLASLYTLAYYFDHRGKK